jgi:hypothetical protein
MLILGHIRKAMPAMFGKEKAQRKMLDAIPDIFLQVGGGGGWVRMGGWGGGGGGGGI